MKSSWVRSFTTLPSLSWTVARSMTTFTSVENVGRCCAWIPPAVPRISVRRVISIDSLFCLGVIKRVDRDRDVVLDGRRDRVRGIEEAVRQFRVVDRDRGWLAVEIGVDLYR